MDNSIFDKTDKGREEIATRKYQLAPRLRTLLLLIDGKHAAGVLLQKYASVGLNEQSIAELMKDGFIQQVAASSASAAKPQSTEPATQSGIRRLPDGQTQFEAIYHFYTETIKNTLGLRGYGLQLKVEKAGSIEEFRELRRPYLEAVLKAKGNEMARSLRNRLDELLYYGEAAPQTTIIGVNAATSE